MFKAPFVPPEFEIAGMDDGRVVYSLVCQKCGGCEATIKGDGSPMSMVHCGACGVWLGRLAALNIQAASRAFDAGLAVDRSAYLPGGRFAAAVPVSRRGAQI